LIQKSKLENSKTV